jgi:hypothetical protein
VCMCLCVCVYLCVRARLRARAVAGACILAPLDRRDRLRTAGRRQLSVCTSSCRGWRRLGLRPRPRRRLRLRLRAVGHRAFVLERDRNDTPAQARSACIDVGRSGLGCSQLAHWRKGADFTSSGQTVHPHFLHLRWGSCPFGRSQKSEGSTRP